MSKKNVYFVQVGFAFDQSLYFPCAVGSIAAYAWQNDFVKEKYNLKEFIFKREAIDSVVSRLDNPYIFAFSNCVWNFEFNKALAKKIKTIYPKCFVIFGGHNVPDGSSLLNEEIYIDILVHGEGEEPFLDLLKALPFNSIQTVQNISFRGTNKVLVETNRENYKNIENYPSPYLTGIFDDLMKKHSDVDFLSVLETNRGCPYSCSYCDWCAGKAVRFFPLDRIMAEIKWLSDKKIEYCFCADSNFGMFKRDIDIVDLLVESKNKTGYPKIFRPCYAKNSDENVFEICKRLNSFDMDKGATLSYQTLCDDALININRKNLTLDNFSGLLSKYIEAGIPSYSELILGLPGETYESFCNGLCELLEAGQHNSISVYYCELLPNSEMAQKSYIEKHGIQTERVPFNHIHSAQTTENSEVQEFSNLIIATKTMSREMWVKANMFSVCVQCFHNLGLLRCFAIYLHFESKIKYLDFYNSLLSFIMNTNGTSINSLFSHFVEKLNDSTGGNWNYRNEKFGEATWFFEEGAFLELVTDYNRFWDEIKPFLKSFEIDEKIFEELLKYQTAIIKRPENPGVDIELDYDLSGYFSDIYSGIQHELIKKKNIFHIIVQNEFSSLKDYAKETVWYGRRRGATMHTNNRGESRVEYLSE
ncbi:MAG: radical SAM protein [Eubacteriales bacterium]